MQQSEWFKAVFIIGILAAAGACHVLGDTAKADPPVQAVPSARAHYLANAGVLIEDGDTKVVFDPLFRNDFGRRYRLVPDLLERALFAGEPPFDGLDAVLISHHHEDHFSPVDILRLMFELPEIQLYAPAQAVAEMRRLATEREREVFTRVSEITLEYKQAPVTIETGELIVEAVRIPHSGWPDARLEVENIAFRVTLTGETTVLHLGDADANDVHYAHDSAYWARRETDIAFPPYWYFTSERGLLVLEQRLKPAHSVGVHVPVTMPSNPDERPDEVQGHDLFLEPGETRDIPR